MGHLYIKTFGNFEKAKGNLEDGSRGTEWLCEGLTGWESKSAIGRGGLD